MLSDRFEVNMRLALLASLVAMIGCSGDGTDGAGDCASDDADGDGLDGCIEQALGTDPDVADSDGDGLTDGEENDCVSDPLDADEQCYACGWRHDDPGDLQSTGAKVGDVIDNVALVDQCEESVSLWDFAEEYHILFMTAEW